MKKTLFLMCGVEKDNSLNKWGLSKKTKISKSFIGTVKDKFKQYKITKGIAPLNFFPITNVLGVSSKFLIKGLSSKV